MKLNARPTAVPVQLQLLMQLLSLLGVLLLGSQASALRVDNFVLLDHLGTSHELYYGDARAVVILIQGNGCPIVRNTLPAFKALRDEYRDQGVRFLMLNANLQDNRDSIASEAVAWDIDIPILEDRAQLIGESLELIRTGEVLVIAPKTWEVVYRGPLNDRLDYERQKEKAQHHYVKDALDDVLADRQVALERVDTIGCLINFPDRKADHGAISYTRTIAPLLKEKCAVCHRPDGIGPWAMTSYDMVRGFAPMMREVLRTRRMPPWHADPHIGRWQGDRSLSVAETQSLVHWIEAGAIRDAGDDPLLEVKAPGNHWPLGEPDLVLTLPAFEVPASGVVDYQFPVVRNTLPDAVWIRAATVIPGDRNVVHHVLVGAADGPTDPQQRSSNGESVFDNYIIGYAPGNESTHMPEGTGVHIPAGADFLLQMHYTPYGKVATDVTRVGLYFAAQPPRNFLRHQVVLDPTIQIPPGVPDHEEVAYYEFDRAALLHHIVPHAHYRGKASRFELVYPDGRSETLLSVPNYDFNWQRTYDFAEPKLVPAGARLVHRTTYDNSAANPGNPDPQRTVPWGLQSHDEMLYGAFSYSWVDETSDKPIHDKARSDTYQMIGFLDADMDGKLSWKELPARMKKQLVQAFKVVDRNGDGGLDVDEFLALQQSREKAEQPQKQDRESTPREDPPVAGH